MDVKMTITLNEAQTNELHKLQDSILDGNIQGLSYSDGELTLHSNNSFDPESLRAAITAFVPVPTDEEKIETEMVGAQRKSGRLTAIAKLKSQGDIPANYVDPEL